jgi:hypothetical protein
MFLLGLLHASRFMHMARYFHHSEGEEITFACASKVLHQQPRALFDLFHHGVGARLAHAG